MSDDSGFAYYVHDNAAFRSKGGQRFSGVDDVRTDKGWQPYEGDRLEPVVYGRKVKMEEALEF